MTKARKIDLLYRIALGQEVDISRDEKRELGKYKVSYVGKTYATKNNISQYITAVDKGCHIGFYDWCMNNHKGDRRRTAGRADSIKSQNKEAYMINIFIGWFFWGIAIFWLFGGSMSVGTCAIFGGIISVVLYRINREAAGFTNFLLPIILVAILANMR